MSGKFDERFMGIGEVAERFNVARHTISRWVERKAFPQPLRYGIRKRIWLRTEIEKYIAAAEAEKQAAEQ